MFNTFTAAPVSGRPSPATGTLPFGIHRAYLPNTQQLCRRSKSGKQRRCLLRSPAEWFSRYSSSTPHLPRLLPPLRMRYVRTSNACVHGMLIHVQLFFSCGVQIGVSFVVGPHERHGAYLRHDIVACYGIVMYLLTTCVVVFKVTANAANANAARPPQCPEAGAHGQLGSSLQVLGPSALWLWPDAHQGRDGSASLQHSS